MAFAAMRRVDGQRQRGARRFGDRNASVEHTLQRHRPTWRRALRSSGPVTTIFCERLCVLARPHPCTCIPEEHDHGMGKLTVRAGLPGATIFAPVPRAPALDLCPGRLATTDAQ